MHVKEKQGDKGRRDIAVTIQDFIDKASAIDMSEVINAAIRFNEDEIIALNTEDQLYKRGIDSWPRQIKPGYAIRTIRDKQDKRQPTDRVTLRDTGEFHGNFKITYNKDSIQFGALPTYRDGIDLTEHLRERYGELIFGLTPVNTKKLQEIIKDDIIIILRNA